MYRGGMPQGGPASREHLPLGDASFALHGSLRLRVFLAPGLPAFYD
jgi:hypothetical protein